MKRLLVCLLVLGVGTLALAGEFTTLTKDGVVTSKDQVQVEWSEQVTAKAVYTLSHITTRIAVLRAEIFRLETELTKYQALKVELDARVGEVKLKEALE